MDNSNERQGAPKPSVLKLTQEQASKDFLEQLDFLNITPLERQNNADIIDLITEAIQMGRLTINEDKTVTQKLLHPIGNQEDVKQLVFKARLQERDLRIHLKGVKATDVDGRLMAHVAALTSVNAALLGYLDKADLKVTHAYITFFI